MKMYELIPIKSIRHKLRARYNPRHEIRIDKNTRCLCVAPHPDDEMIGCGGLLCLYPDNFDVVIMGSSGTDYKNRTAHEHAKTRTAEFNAIMKKLGIKNHWIYQTYGVRGIEQMDAMFEQYIRDLDTKKYDYIFLPVPHDRHQDHNHITNKLFKRILRKNGYSKDLKIVFYEVWSLIPNPNVFVDITSVIDKKCKILSMYKSAHVLFQYAEVTNDLNRCRGHQTGMPEGYAEAYYIDSVCNYIKNNYKIDQDYGIEQNGK